jgi:hypothetical protein
MKVKTIVKTVLPGRVYSSLGSAYHRCFRNNRVKLVTRRDFSGAPATAAPSPYPFFIKANNELEQLAERHQPSKRLHNYMPYYWMHFRDIRESVRVFCEIGIQSDRSIRMWEEFFPNAEIHGIDIDPKCKEFEGNRIKIHIGSQDDPDFLNGVLAKMSQAPDVIIDDGSHIWYHQVETFSHLYPRLSEHGIYVVEDTGGCVGDFELKTIKAIKPMIDSVMFWPEGREPSTWGGLHTFPETASWQEKNTIGMAFYRWLVFVFRGRNPEDNHYLGDKKYF